MKHVDKSFHLKLCRESFEIRFITQIKEASFSFHRRTKKIEKGLEKIEKNVIPVIEQTRYRKLYILIIIKF